MLDSIEQKLSAIKAINEKIAGVELACNKLSLNNEIDWDLLPKDVRKTVQGLVRSAYDEVKAGLLEKAAELMK